MFKQQTLLRNNTRFEAFRNSVIFCQQTRKTTTRSDGGEGGDRRGGEGSAGEKRLSNIPAKVQYFLERSNKDKRLEYLYNKQTQSHVLLIGSVHKSLDCANLIWQIIADIEPDCVVVELDKPRATLLRGKFLKDLTYYENIKEEDEEEGEEDDEDLEKIVAFEDHLFHLVKAHLILPLLRMFPRFFGCDLFAAIDAAELCGASIVFGDRSTKKTMQRLVNEISQKPVDDYFKDGLQFPFNPLRRTNYDKMREFSRFLEIDALVHERDIIFINSLRKRSENIVVGVMGLAHLDGVVKYWDNFEQRMEEKGITREDLE